MINESEMKTKKGKNEKWNMCVSQTWPYTSNGEIRPNVVLECSFEHKPYLRESERIKLGFWEEVRFGAKI